MPRQPHSFPAAASAPISWPEAVFLWRGRLGRRRYVIYSLINGGVILGMLALALGLPQLHLGLLALAAFGFGFWSCIALAAKRFRDLDLPGTLAIPIVLAGDTSGSLMPRLHEGRGFVSLCLVAIALCLVLVKGSTGPNRYASTPDRRF